MSKTALITGSAGLVGSEAAILLGGRGWHIVGIDNDMRRHFFGPSASTQRNRQRLEAQLDHYTHVDTDIRDLTAIETLVRDLAPRLGAVIHTAAQPSHDWAARDPLTDFGVNATGTLNLLETVRRHAPETPFLFTSTNKVYGDTPNRLPFIEEKTRYRVAPDHRFAQSGIDETMSVDQSLHSVFGASKVAADIMVQEYGRYFDMPTVCFRGGCLTGPAHAGAELHGFLAYLVRACVEGRPYRVFGHKGKQVRDNLDAQDLADAFWHFIEAPSAAGAVYNIGGGLRSNCSMLEAIKLVEEASGRTLDWTYDDSARRGDHMWWISDLGRFRADYPDWDVRKSVPEIIKEIVRGIRDSGETRAGTGQ